MLRTSGLGLVSSVRLDGRKVYLHKVYIKSLQVTSYSLLTEIKNDKKKKLNIYFSNLSYVWLTKWIGKHNNIITYYWLINYNHKLLHTWFKRAVWLMFICQIFIIVHLVNWKFTLHSTDLISCTIKIRLERGLNLFCLSLIVFCYFE